MPKIDFQFAVVTRKLEGEACLVEPLLFPGASSFGEEPERQEALVRDWVKKFMETIPLESHWRYQQPELPEVETVWVRVEPPKRDPCWELPVDLTFHVLTWQQDERAAIGFVPALGIEVIAAKIEQLPKKLETHILFCLQRLGYTKSLMKLAPFERIREVSVAMHTVPVRVKTPKESARDASNPDDADSVLEETSENLVGAKLAPAYEVETPLRQLVDLISGPHASSVLLVGPAGVGKTGILHELVRRRRDFHLGHSPFYSTSGSRLVAGMCGYGMWQQRCTELCKEVARQDAVLHLGNLLELMDAGKSTHNQRGVASFLVPYLLRGDFTAIAECTPEQISLIEREDPRALEAFTRLDISEPDESRTLAILNRAAQALPTKTRPFLDAGALDMLYRLHARYAAYSVKPGRMLRFLKNLALDQSDLDRSLNERDVLGAFSRETGLPLFMLDDSIPLDTGRIRTWFAQRVLGQPKAIDVLVDALTVIKTRLARPRKPIASLLFAGPTGVGKTETAKALARFLFGDRSRLVRIDMSEYANPAAAIRLIGGVDREEGVLTAKVREQPFSVILLDEFEKAHPDVHDLLLQVLGEGRLTDASGRLADFSNAVIILTSNLGSDSFQRGLAGFSDEGDHVAQALAHFADAVRNFLRPEMFNRFDALVPFQPLDREAVHAIARRELDKVQSRDGLRLRDSILEVSPSLLTWLSETGYDPRFGARPLKRCIDGVLLAQLAEQMNLYDTKTALAAVADRGDGLDIRVQPRLDKDGKPFSGQQGSSFARKLVRDCSELRRDMDRLMGGPRLVELDNECTRLEQAMLRDHAKMVRRQFVNWDDNAMRQRQQRLRAVMDACEEQQLRAGELEREVLLDFNDKQNLYAGPYHTRLSGLTQAFHKLLADVHALAFDQPDRVGIAVFSEFPVPLFELTQAYFAIASKVEETRVEVHEITLWYHAKSESNRFKPVLVEAPENELAEPRGGVIGFLLDICGPLAHPAYATEQGLHVFKRNQQAMRCLVDITDKDPVTYEPPAGVARKGWLPEAESRRTYDVEAHAIRDVRLEKSYAWNEALPQTLDRILADNHAAGILSVMPS